MNTRIPPEVPRRQPVFQCILPSSSWGTHQHALLSLLSACHGTGNRHYFQRFAALPLRSLTTPVCIPLAVAALRSSSLSLGLTRCVLCDVVLHCAVLLCCGAGDPRVAFFSRGNLGMVLTNIPQVLGLVELGSTLVSCLGCRSGWLVGCRLSLSRGCVRLRPRESCGCKPARRWFRGDVRTGTSSNTTAKIYFV